VGAGLLICVVDLTGQAERGGVPGAGRAGLAGGERHFTEAVEHIGFTGPVAPPERSPTADLDGCSPKVRPGQRG